MKSEILLIALPLLGLAVVFGFIAIISPDLFRKVAQGGARWFDTSKILAKLDAPVNIDHKVLSHSRLFGFAVISSSLFLAYVLYHRLAGPFGF